MMDYIKLRTLERDSMSVVCHMSVLIDFDRKSIELCYNNHKILWTFVIIIIFMALK